LIATAVGLTLSIATQTRINEYRVTNASRSYDFVVRIQEHSWQGTDEYREGPGKVLIFRKGASKPFQTIDMENIFVSRDKHGQPLPPGTVAACGSVVAPISDIKPAL